MVKFLLCRQISLDFLGQVDGGTKIARLKILKIKFALKEMEGQISYLKVKNLKD